MLRSVRSRQSRLICVSAIEKLANYVDDEVRLQRLVPYLVSLLTPGDPSALVKAQTIKTLTRIVSTPMAWRDVPVVLTSAPSCLLSKLSRQVTLTSSPSTSFLRCLDTSARNLMTWWNKPTLSHYPSSRTRHDDFWRPLNCWSNGNWKIQLRLKAKNWHRYVRECHCCVTRANTLCRAISRRNLTRLSIRSKSSSKLCSAPTHLKWSRKHCSRTFRRCACSSGKRRQPTFCCRWLHRAWTLVIGSWRASSSRISLVSARSLVLVPSSPLSCLPYCCLKFTVRSSR